MKRHRRRKCRGCGDLYEPDYRNRRHQEYCTKTECRRASKRARQTKWRASPKGCDYFQGPENVARVQQWRTAHPQYWRRQGRVSGDALQDDCVVQPTGVQEVGSILMRDALQDVCSLQPALLVGLVSSLTGSALQDDIAGSLRRFQARGQEILGMGLGIVPRRVDRHDRKTSARRRPASPRAAAVQLG
ncbi:MAG: hypothetical protein BWK77_07430 [Verrucomicrobia bacterium A1]|nr:MAG: hypothetical protein BWK77_07430 [Verrucomicrobia bacterium A1]